MIVNELGKRLIDGRNRGKTSSIVIVAEGERNGGAEKVAALLRQQSSIDSRVVILGHIQRGGSPTASDRILATELGAYAVDLVQKGVSGVMAGKVNGRLVATPFDEAVNTKKPLSGYLVGLLPALAS